MTAYLVGYLIGYLVGLFCIQQGLLQGLQQQGISLLLISHALRVVQHLCDQVCVLYRGEVVEYGPAETVLRNPVHPYTQKLLAAAYLR